MSTGMPPTAKSSNQPLGTSGDQRRRVLCHHLPLAVASAVALALFMSVPIFDAKLFPHGDIFSGTFPQQRDGDHTGPMGHHEDHTGLRHGGGHTGPMGHGEDHTGPIDQDEMMEMMASRALMRRFTIGTGYVALGLLGLTLLIGPANL
ncbi:MAG: hypothetical protein GEU90_22735, partial [Gemmatimonas sp.]|nr:hypothetical protein [Gemmatimonas sp.]